MGRATVDGDWLGLWDVQVADPDRDRQPAGAVAAELVTALVTALVAWGRGRGARRGHVEVRADDDAAQALWRHLGFWHHHDYHYRGEDG